MQKLFMRVPVDPRTHDPAGPPELVVGGMMADDFCLYEDAGVAYLTTHRQNTIDRVPLQPGGGARQVVAGERVQPKNASVASKRSPTTSVPRIANLIRGKPGVSRLTGALSAG